jgi:hypothetical protein
LSVTFIDACEGKSSDVVAHGLCFENAATSDYQQAQQFQQLTDQKRKILINVGTS